MRWTNPFSTFAHLAAAISTRAPGAVLSVAVVAAAVGGWLGALHVPLDADTNALIGPDRPFMQRYQAFLDEFGDLEDMIVVIDPLGADALAEQRAEAAVRAVNDALVKLVERGQLTWVHASISVDEQWRVAPHAMSERELHELARARTALELLAHGQAAAALEQADRAVTSPLPDRAGVESAIVTLDALAPPVVDHREPGAAEDRAARDRAAHAGHADDRSLGAALPDRFLRSEHGRLWFVQAMPAKDFANFNAIAAPLAAVREALASVQAHHPGVDIGLTGKPVLQEDELATSNADMGRSSLLSLAVITVLFIWLFRGMRRPLLAVAAFGIAVGITMGLAWLLVGRITLLSSVFLLVLVGAGLDYGVHIVSRFNEYLADGSRTLAAERTVREAGPGTLSGACATAVVFALAIITDFGGLRELGMLACAGLITSAVVMVTVLPALLVVAGGAATAPPRTTALWMRAPARMVVVITAIAIVAAAVVAPSSLRFDANLLSMQAEGLDSVAWEQRVLTDDATQTWFAASTASGPDAAWTRREALRGLPEVARIRSAFDVIRLPTAAADRARAELAAAIPAPLAQGSIGPDPRYASAAPSAPDSSAATIAVPSSEPAAASNTSTTIDVTAEQARGIAAGLERLATLAAGSGQSEGAPILSTLAVRWRSIERALADSTQATAMLTELNARAARTERALAELRAGCLMSVRDALPAAVRASSISPAGSWLLQVVPAGDAWDEPTLREFVTQVRTIDPDVTGVPVTQVESIADMRRAFEFVSWLSLAAILVIAWIDFGSLRTALLATTTVVAGVLIMLGLLGPLGLSLNLANFFAVPMLLGLGIDSAIHVLHRWKRDPEGLPATLTATAFTGVTTAIGFGALVLADHRGLASLGWAMLVGSLACVIVAVVALPAFLRWRAS
jgi:predicted RND superfamily exporter protein